MLKILTAKMRRTIFGATAGYILSIFPVLFAYLTVGDKNQTRLSNVIPIPKFRPSIDIDPTELKLNIFGIIQLSVENVIFCINEILFASIAMGVAAGLAWWEADINVENAGKRAGMYSGLATLGAIFAVVLFAILSAKSLDISSVSSEVSYMLSISSHLLIGVSLFYFSGILQIRRLRDIIR